MNSTIRHAVTGFCQGATITLALAIAVPSAAWPADPKPAPKPLRSVTLRVMPEAAFYGREEHFRVTSVTATSCTVQVDQASLRAQGEPLLLAAFRACWTAKPEPKGCRTITLEDGSKVRAIVSPALPSSYLGSWSKDGCDQGKVGRKAVGA